MTPDLPVTDEAIAHQVYAKHRREAAFMAILALLFLVAGIAFLVLGATLEGLALFVLAGVQLLILRKWLKAMEKARRLDRLF